MVVWIAFDGYWWIVFDMGLHGVRLVDPESPTGTTYVLNSEVEGIRLANHRF